MEDKHNAIPLKDGTFILAWDRRCPECAAGIKCNRVKFEYGHVNSEDDLPLVTPLNN